MSAPIVDLTGDNAAEVVKDWDTLRHVVTANGGVSRVVMWLLRDLEEKGRLGVHVRSAISRRLDSLGLAHLPVDLPSDQYDIITVYRRGTASATVIDATYHNGNSEEAETALRRLNTSQDAEKLEAVTEKVAELTAILEGVRYPEGNK
ncbi:hypothetical protein [Streptomyces zagrosensis]|uniref:Uncharacterized protein n=1 Tax=Streptomyces zagrosensis TaxID=1042984 RepID=A0A7W9QGF5_9ACTN|nr:hypothetical protein [Streptomyces zagrosensis]MBB5939268.1 hypothetical protein [Streptomyces zagrosensis]